MSQQAASSKHSKPLRILHIITSLDVGGAEVMLAKLLASMNRERFLCSVVCLLPVGPVGGKIADQGISVQSLNLSRGKINLFGLTRLASIVRSFKPDAVMSWLYHADLLCAICRPLYLKVPLIWNVRCSDLDFSAHRPLTGRVVKTLARLSFIPHAVVVNSRAGQKAHQNLGYKPRQWEFIPNGFDQKAFAPNMALRHEARSEFGLLPNHLVAGMAARFDPSKGHSILLKAAAKVVRQIPDARFLLCGTGATPQNEALAGLIRQHALERACLLVGPRSDMARIYNAFDVLVSSSLTEGFSNSIGEGMACGLPCVVTDAGDSAFIVGPKQKVVPAGDADALADALIEVLGMEQDARHAMGADARQRVMEHFALPAIASRYEELFLRLCSKARGKPLL
ncbi:MAG: glycosyltransferase [Desulfatibacillaceae bacterium]|nr:glycosyltransferase [Desulfatibacillaceae bacterium]